jgi:hypothetical protein
VRESFHYSSNSIDDTTMEVFYLYVTVKHTHSATRGNRLGAMPISRQRIAQTDEVDSPLRPLRHV